MMRRREALKTIGGLAGAAGLTRLLPGCGGGGPDGITTIVYMMMENRSYDHMLGGRPLLESKPGDGLPMGGATNPDLNGNPVTSYQPTTAQLCDLDPPHDWDSARIQWNSGANDGFITVHQTQYGDTAIDPMQYLTRTDVPVTWTLADAYTTCDRWFSSVLGPTWPNRFYWHTGTSNGIMTNALPTSLDWPSIYHRLNAKNVDWAYYYGNIPVVSVIQGLDLTGKVFRFQQFFNDAEAGTLPPVSYIDPAFFENDDHPPIHPINGQQLIASVYNALAQSPQWKNCLLVVTYDENGGFYDHVSPPQTADDHAATGFNQLGFRVPTMVIGPYVKQGYVSSVQYDHTSALKHLQVMFDLDPLTMRSTAANDLTDCIDLERLAKNAWAKPVAIPAVDPSTWPMGAACDYTADRVGSASHSVIEWADANPDLIDGLDLRSELPEYKSMLSHASGVLARRAKQRVR